MRYKRLIAERILSLQQSFPALVLTGARQAGKTTLLRTLFSDYSYVSLDSFENADLAENSPAEFLSKFPRPLIVDEVQYAPKLFRHLKVIIDQERDLKGQFILTGSQKFTLMKEVSDSLAGRVALLELEGLCSEELGSTLQEAVKNNGPAYVLSRGMFPELWQDQSIPVSDYFRSYLSTYIERDVRQILNINSLRDFDRFMRVAASRNGQLLNKTDIAKDVGVTPKTIGDWLSVLEASNQISLLEPYFKNIGKRIVKSPRLFFNDPGLLCFLLGLSENALSSYSGIGFIWEAYVYAELRKIKESYSPQTSYWFYRDGGGQEVDILIDFDGKIRLAEIKWTELVTPRHEQNLVKIAPYFGNALRDQMIICRSNTSTTTSQTTKVVNGFELGKGLLLGD